MRESYLPGEGNIATAYTKTFKLHLPFCTARGRFYTCWIVPALAAARAHRSAICQDVRTSDASLEQLCTGKAMYGMDARVDGMVYASIERPPVFGGKVKTLDDQAALKVAGVHQTVGIDPFKPPAAFQPLGGVAVIADNTWAAFQGGKKLKGPAQSYPAHLHRPSQFQRHRHLLPTTATLFAGTRQVPCACDPWEHFGAALKGRLESVEPAPALQLLHGNDSLPQPLILNAGNFNGIRDS